MTTQEKIKRLNTTFSNNTFAYTLSPPLRAISAIDEFLFYRKKPGFCSPTTLPPSAYMLRLAKRAITELSLGIKVAKFNPVSGLVCIKFWRTRNGVESFGQCTKDAVRIDPTANCSPNRVLSGLLSMVQIVENLGNNLRFSLTNLTELCRLTIKVIDGKDRSYLEFKSYWVITKEGKITLLKNIFGNIASTKASATLFLLALLLVRCLLSLLLYTKTKAESVHDEIKMDK